ncbi:MAG: hypothetical protein ACK4NF_00470 [Planctomycetota bacterium]
MLFLVISSKGGTFILWGGNLASTLAGEFCFSFSFLFFVLYTGVLYRALISREKKKYFLPLVVLEVIIGLSHAFTMIYILLFLFLLMTHKKVVHDNFIYVVLQQVFALGFMLWWLLPMIYYKDYTFSQWYESWNKDIFLHQNVISLTIIVFTLFLFSLTYRKGIKMYIKEHSVLFIGFLGIFILGILANYIAYPLGVADIRFFPLTLIAGIFLAGFFFEFFSLHFVFRGFFCLGVLFLTLWLVKPEEKIIRVWSRFNGRGLKFSNYYEHFEQITQALKGDLNNGRIIYDKSNIYDPLGSPLALTLLPHYAKRQVLDGMDYRSTASSFFAFDLQTSISSSWGSYPDGFKFTDFNLRIAKKRAKILNVENFIITDPNNIKKFLDDPDFSLIKKIGPFHIFSFKNYIPKYVEPLSKEPILVATNNWKAFSYRWFKNLKLMDYKVIFIRNKKDLKKVKESFTTKIYLAGDEEERNYLANKLNLNHEEVVKYLPLTDIDSRLYNTDDLYIDEYISYDGIEINVNKLNIPLYVKISYHPGLKIEGADYIYFSAPSFFIIIPREKKVRIYLGYNFVDKVGMFFLYLSLLLFSGAIVFYRRINPSIPLNKVFASLIAIISIAVVILLISIPLYRLLSGIEHLKYGAKSANRLLSEAVKFLYSTDKKEQLRSKQILEYIKDKYREVGFIDEVLYKYAELNFELDNLSTVDNTLTQIFTRYPESIYYGKGIILSGKLLEKIGTDESREHAKLQYLIAKREYANTEIETEADNELNKFGKRRQHPIEIKRRESLSRILKRLDRKQKENLKILLQSKEFQELLKYGDRKILYDILEKIKGK